MRRILVDRARARRSLKRGGGAAQVELPAGEGEVPARGEELLALDEALRRLSQADDRRAEVVELRYFGGLTIEETAEIAGLQRDLVHLERGSASTPIPASPRCFKAFATPRRTCAAR
jgi:DNA-directed RNA polymerase specialized sigma24 family protein